ncbi:MAG: DUF2079 domain-containing protein [Flavobacteriales bacterium]|nr:DUF2079 domain-containing protein [Flavobacteriales bacterium]MCZ2442316.1 DUF2079 domain-containing protein [Flavobacteriales bacterium]
MTRSEKRIFLFLSILITLVYAGVFSSISLWNHYVFRTFAFDLGIKNQALWDYAHLRMNFNTVITLLDGEANILSNHFEPTLMLFAPFYYLFGSYTLLVMQIIFWLIGGWGIRRLILRAGGSIWLAMMTMLVFYSMWGVIGAIGFDYHANVIAAAVVPWFFVFAYERKPLAAALILFFVMNSKENMALWAVFLSVGILWHFRRDKNQRKWYIALTLFSAVYFLLIMTVFMPYFAQGKVSYPHFRYSALGGSMGEALKTLITRPAQWIPLIWDDGTTGQPLSSNPKLQLYWHVFLSGALLLLFRPKFIIMLIPIIAQKIFSDDPMHWGIYNHYSIEFVPIIAAAGGLTLAAVKNKKIHFMIGVLWLLSVLDATKGFMDAWQPNPYNRTQIRFYKSSHYTREIPYEAYHKILTYYIPKDASVSATSYLVPHLAMRERIYQFPHIGDAEYVVVAEDFRSYYPFPFEDKSKYIDARDRIENDSSFVIVFRDRRLLISKRKYNVSFIK